MYPCADAAPFDLPSRDGVFVRSVNHPKSYWVSGIKTIMPSKGLSVSSGFEVTPPESMPTYAPEVWSSVCLPAKNQFSNGDDVKELVTESPPTVLPPLEPLAPKPNTPPR